ncbi:MAG TPA: hypothetical protein VHJ54_01545 [Solirubrobacterales bacterium]|nr:hypothetical protein [Solirubrobacterales bacterium]
MPGNAGLKMLAAAAVVAAVVLGGCRDDGDGTSPPPRGPFGVALREIGGGGAGTLGVGWADPQLVTKSGRGAEAIAAAVAPNAASIVEQARSLRRHFGLAPLEAEQLISVGGSYAFGLRLDGVDGRGLAKALVADGGRSRQRGELELVEIGDYAVVPEALLRLDVRGLGAFDAFGRDLVVLAISDRARAALLGRGDRLLEEPAYRAAADCLHDAVAVRTIPDKHLLSSEVGIEQVAIGITTDGEVLCVVGGTPERADDIAAGLERSLAPDAEDPVTGERIGDSLAGVEVSRSSYDGVELVRAQATTPAGGEPGFFFAAVSRGSLVGLLNGSDSFLP